MTQRPIEFRAWDKKKEKMYPVATIGLGGNAIQLTADWQPLSSVILLQFTGLYDKNKKKVFEGDILEDVWGVRQEVVWFEDSTHALTGFTFKPVKRPEGFYTTETSWLKVASIIGNRLENPDLLSV